MARGCRAETGREVGGVAAKPRGSGPGPSTVSNRRLRARRGAAIANSAFDRMVAHNRKTNKSHSGIWRVWRSVGGRPKVDAQIGPVVEIGATRAIATR